jgi:hypothetical protein
MGNQVGRTVSFRAQAGGKAVDESTVTTRGPLRRRLSVLLKSEAGIALPVTLFAMISSMALAGTAVLATIDSQHGATRDDASKQAIAAADAGANIARVRQTRYAFILNERNPCLRVNEETEQLEKSAAEVVDGHQWCPQIAGTVGDASYVYRVSPVGLACGEDELCVVSTGTAGEVSRRIEVTYDRSGAFKNEQENTTWHEEIRTETEKIEQELKESREEGNINKTKELEEKRQTLLEEESKKAHLEGFVGREGITISGNGDIRVGVGTNGNLETSGNASICGDIRHGIGKRWLSTGNANQCSGYEVTEANVELPSVASFIPVDIATNNSDYRLVTCAKTAPAAGCQSDTLTGDKWSSNYPFNPTTREISLSGNATLTVGGGDYWICSITFSGNSQLIIAKGARVRFFFDTPENCGNNGNQLSFSGNNRISATGYQPSLGQFELPGFYFLGSPTVASQINLSGNSSVTNELIIYGPNTSINVSGNATWKGIIAGKRIAMSGNGTVEQDAGFEVPPELNPKPSEPSETIKKLEEEIEALQGGGTETEEERKHKEELLQTFEGELSTKTNRAPIYYTPQAYFECTGSAGAASTPNASC